MNESGNDIILNKIESDFNKVIPVIILVSLLSAIASYNATTPRHLVWADIIIAITFFVLYVKKIGVKYKITVSVLMCFYMGSLSYLAIGYESAGAILFAAGNVVAVLFLSRKSGIIYTIGNIIVFVFIWRLLPSGGLVVRLTNQEWIVQILMVTLFGALLQTVVYSAKKYLILSILDLEEKNMSIESLAYYDQLTKIANLSYLKEKMDIEETSGFLILVSIKNYNVLLDVYGEKFTNSLIEETIRIISNHDDNKIVLSRIGENRFVILYEKTSEEIVVDEFNKYRRIFNERNSNKDYKNQLTFYKSMYRYNQGDDLDESIHKATIAMLYAIENDLDEIIEYDAEFEKRILDIEYKKELLKRAIEKEEFEVYFQEKVDARSNEVIGVEALARWYTDELGFISPGEFIPLVEVLSSANTFGNQIINKTLKQYTNLRRKYGKDLYVSINISPTFLMSDEIIDSLRDNIVEYNVPFDKVIVEITEDIAIIGLEEVNSKLQEIREMNIKVSLDDFGSGYSSLNYLMSFKVDEIKIDKSLIDKLDNNPLTIVMLENISNMIHQMGLTLIIEGVETHEQVDKLLAIGCHYIQGYVYSKPKKLDSNQLIH